MPKILCLAGAVVAGLVLLIFGLDLSVGFPFNGASAVMDIGLILCALILGYLSWVTLRQCT